MANLMDSFLDNFKKPKVKSTESVGSPGTAVFGGYIDENELNPSLKGPQKFITYTNILVNTSIAAAGTRYFLNLVAKATWTMEAVDESSEAELYVEKLKDVMDNMDTPWQRVVRRAAMYRFHGFSIQEWTAKINEDGTVGMKDISPRPQTTITRWDLDTNGSVEGVIQRSPQSQEEIYLPRGKIVYIVDDTLNDSPEGLGLLRHVVSPADSLKRFEQLEGYGFETDLRGIPIGRAPFAALQQAVEDGDITEEQKTAAEAPLKQFIQNHIKNPQLGLVLDSTTYETADEAERPSGIKQWDMELLKAGSNSQAEIAKSIERLNMEIAVVLGVEGLLLGSKDAGSNALSTDKSHNLAMIVDSTLGELATTFERDFRDVVWELNGWPQEYKPKMKTEATQYRDVQQITGALRDLSVAGAVLSLDDPAINEVRDLIGLSKQTEIANITTQESLALGEGTNTGTLQTVTSSKDKNEDIEDE